MSRNSFMKKLANQGIGSQVLYIPVFMQTYYQKKYKFRFNDFTNSISYYEKALSIPIFFDITKKELKFVSKSIKEILQS